MNNQWFSKIAVWLVIALVLFTVFKQFDRGATRANEIGYSDFLEEVRGKRIKSVQLRLAELGYDPGTPDGALGGRTLVAIRRFETDRGLPVTGGLSDQLIAELNKSNPQ